MPLKLSRGEKVIRCWNYAGDNTSSGRNDDVLIVTDRRLVATSSSPGGIRRTEILLDSIKSVSSSYSSQKTERSSPKGGLIAAGIFFVLAAIVLLALSGFKDQIFLASGLIAGVVGIVFIIIGAVSKTPALTSARFSLVIATHGQEGSPVAIGKKAGDATQTVVINSATFNEKVIMDIIDTIGAVALNKIPPAQTVAQDNNLINGAEIAVPAEEHKENTVKQ